MPFIPELSPTCPESELAQRNFFDNRSDQLLAVTTPNRLLLNLMLAASTQPLSYDELQQPLMLPARTDVTVLKRYIAHQIAEGTMITADPDTRSGYHGIGRGTMLEATERSRESLSFFGAVAVGVLRHELPMERLTGKRRARAQQTEGRVPGNVLRLNVVQHALAHNNEIDSLYIKHAYPDNAARDPYYVLDVLHEDRVFDRIVRPGTKHWSAYRIASWIQAAVSDLMLSVGSLDDPGYAKEAVMAAEAIASEDTLKVQLIQTRLGLPQQIEPLAVRSWVGLPDWLSTRLHEVQLDDASRHALAGRLMFLFERGVVRVDEHDSARLAFGGIARLHCNPAELRALAQTSLLERRLLGSSMQPVEIKRHLGLAADSSIDDHVEQVIMPRLREVLI
jgi:hypothetical protein